jgi:hypothetical protein
VHTFYNPPGYASDLQSKVARKVRDEVTYEDTTIFQGPAASNGLQLSRLHWQRPAGNDDSRRD